MFVMDNVIWAEVKEERSLPSPAGENGRDERAVWADLENWVGKQA